MFWHSRSVWRSVRHRKLCLIRRTLYTFSVNGLRAYRKSDISLVSAEKHCSHFVFCCKETVRIFPRFLYEQFPNDSRDPPPVSFKSARTRRQNRKNVHACHYWLFSATVRRITAFVGTVDEALLLQILYYTYTAKSVKGSILTWTPTGNRFRRILYFLTSYRLRSFY